MTLNTFGSLQTLDLSKIIIHNSSTSNVTKSHVKGGSLMKWRYCTTIADRLHRLENDGGEVFWGVEGVDADDVVEYGRPFADVRLPSGDVSLFLIEPLSGGLAIDVVRAYQGLVQGELITLVLGFLDQLSARPVISERHQIWLEGIGFDATGRPCLIPGMFGPTTTSLHRSMGELIYHSATGTPWTKSLLPVDLAMKSFDRSIRELTIRLLVEASTSSRHSAVGSRVKTLIAEVRAVMVAAGKPCALPLLPVDHDLDPAQALTARLRSAPAREALSVRPPMLGEPEHNSSTELQASPLLPVPSRKTIRQKETVTQLLARVDPRTWISSMGTAKQSTAPDKSSRRLALMGKPVSHEPGGFGTEVTRQPSRDEDIEGRSERSSGMNRLRSAARGAYPRFGQGHSRGGTSKHRLLLGVALTTVLIGVTIMVWSGFADRNAATAPANAVAEPSTVTQSRASREENVDEQSPSAGPTEMDGTVAKTILEDLCRQRAEALESGNSDAFDALTVPGSEAAKAAENIDLGEFTGGSYSIELSEITINRATNSSIQAWALMTSSVGIDGERHEFGPVEVEFELAFDQGKWKVAQVREITEEGRSQK